MDVYVVHGMDSYGSEHKLIIGAESENDARAKARAQGYFPTLVNRTTSKDVEPAFVDVTTHWVPGLPLKPLLIAFSLGGLAVLAIFACAAMLADILQH